MTTTTDTELAEHIRQSMLLDDRLSEQAIDVHVADGVVRLEGTVQSHRRELAAIEIAASFVGCDDVQNQLRVEPAPHLADDEIRDNVRRALAVHPDVPRATVAVVVQDGVVSLRGNVRTQWERTQAEDAALAAAGVRSIENLLLVDVPGHFEDTRMRDEIKQALSNELGVDARAIRVAVAADTAVLSGRAPTHWHREKAGEIVHRSRILHLRNDIDVTDAPSLVSNSR